MKPIEDYINYIKNIRGYSANTCRAYEKDVREFASWMLKNHEEARWSIVTRDDIDAYITYMSNQGKKPATTNRSLASISSMYDYFHRKGWLTENPTKYESRKKMANTLPNTIPVANILKAIEKNIGVKKYMLQMLWTTGIRIQELLDIKWQDVNFDENSIKIHGKGNSERIVYTTEETLSYIRPHVEYARKDFRIILFNQRTARQLIYEALMPYSRAKQLSPHAIRHTYATELAKAGVNNSTIQQRLGHQRLETSQRYINNAQIETGQKCLTIISNLKQ